MITSAPTDRPRSSVRAYAIVLVVAVIAILAGCARFGVTLSWRSSTESRQPGAFSTVSVASSIRLHVRIGSPASVAVTADDAVLPHVVTVVRDDRLFLDMDGVNLASEVVSVDVVTPALSAIAVSSSAQAIVDGLSADAFDISADSSAAVRIVGSVAQLRLRASSSADIDGAHLAVGTAQVELASSSRATINASGRIQGSVRESADLVVLGPSDLVDVSESSSGHVTRH